MRKCEAVPEFRPVRVGGKNEARRIVPLRRCEGHRAFFDDLQGRLAPQVNYVDSRIALTIRGPVGGGAEISWQDLDMDFQSLCKDRRFFNAVSAAANYTWDVVAANILLAGELEVLKTRIESELAFLRAP